MTDESITGSPEEVTPEVSEEVPEDTRKEFREGLDQLFTMSPEEFVSQDAVSREVMLFVLVRDMAAEVRVMSDIIASVGQLTDKIGDKILELEDPAKRDALIQQFMQSMMGGMGEGMFG